MRNIVGRIRNWRIEPTPSGDGHWVVGESWNHTNPRFRNGDYIHTSRLTNVEFTEECEVIATTLNSVYLLEGPMLEVTHHG